MPFPRKLWAAAAAASVLLVACGGGGAGDEDLTPSNKVGVLTVRDASLPELNGLYGDGTLNLTDVVRNNPIGSDTPELCAFKFDGAKKADNTAVEAFGDVRYRSIRDSSQEGLYVIYLTFAGNEYTSDDPIDTSLRRDLDQVILTAKTLRATNGSGATVRVDAIIPMRGNRPTGC